MAFTIARLFLLGMLVSGAWSEANAQTPEADRWYVNVSGGASPQDETFTGRDTFDAYGQQGTLTSAYESGGGRLFDIGAGMRVWKRLALGVGFSANTNRHDAIVNATVPHPLVANQPREASAIAPDLEHRERVVHVHVAWMLPLTGRFQLRFMGGPSFFMVRQQLATIRAPQDLREETPFTGVTITNVTVTEVKDNPVGVNVGADASFELARVAEVGIGVGGFLRYIGAALDFPTLTGTARESVLAGGHQWGVGLRLSF